MTAFAHELRTGRPLKNCRDCNGSQVEHQLDFLAFVADLFLEWKSTPREWADHILSFLTISRATLRSMLGEDKSAFLETKTRAIQTHVEGKCSQKEWKEV